jgi:hypothetical protein
MVTRLDRSLFPHHVGTLMRINRHFYEQVLGDRYELPYQLCSDQDWKVADGLCRDMSKLGVECELEFLPYSSRCTLRLESVTAITGQLVKRIASLRGEGAMQSKAWLGRIPAVLLPEVNVGEARCIIQELSKIGAQATLELHHRI